ILHRDGRVTECAHSNVHILKDGVFQTAPCDNLILPGITRAHRIAQAKAAGIRVVEEPFMLEDLFNADEVFFTSASALCCRITEIDGKPVGGRDSATLHTLQELAWKEALEEVEKAKEAYHA
ncbi:MAG: aminotransferase class IV, partial [Eubacterium sp.]|nr:aminotransferase class IV [Eubacterium sp.]